MPDGGFTWVTGEPFAFQAFGDGDPDVPAIPDCVALGDDHKWHDRRCDGSEFPPDGVICEID